MYLSRSTDSKSVRDFNTHASCEQQLLTVQHIHSLEKRRHHGHHEDFFFVCVFFLFTAHAHLVSPDGIVIPTAAIDG